ncbi:MAG: hypothetical protein J6S49_09755, partial [Erysipelotrichaceae bacterium]|nr:hypothetical protein [Erysipelotrichaceae bacterium]
VKYRAEDVIDRSSGTITPEAEYLFTKDVGNYEFHYHIRKFVFEKEVVFTYEVVDTTAPVIDFKQTKILKDPNEEYTDEQIRDNISINEGSYEYETDYDAAVSGPYSVIVTAQDEYGNVSSASYEVEVRDIEPPMVFVSGDGAQVYTGSEVEVLDLISYGDNVDPNPQLKIEGEIDTSKPGFYTVYCELKDFSGNVTSWDMTVEVADSFPEYIPSDYYYPFEEFLDDYSGYNVMYGIDVSSWQGDIDFEKVRDAGCEFVIIRIGFSYNGTFTLDNRFEQNLERAKEAGLKIGIYHFSYDNNEADLLDALNNIFTKLHGTKLDLPIVFDWEDFGDYNDYEMSFRQLNKLYDFFQSEVHKHGYECMLYGSQYYLDRVWTHTDRRPIWLAQYNDRPTYEGEFEIWQLTDSGRIDGIDGNVDLNLLFLRQ